MKWYKRSGQRVSQKRVKQAKDNYAIAKRTGQMDNLKCSKQPAVADSIDKMSLIEFANFSGMFTYRKEGE